MIGAGNDRQFGILCECIERRELVLDERFLTNALRVANREVLLELIQGEIETRRTEEWLSIFEGKGMPYAAIKYSPFLSPFLISIAAHPYPFHIAVFHFCTLRWRGSVM